MKQTSKKPKSQRTAFIRVKSVNETRVGVISYSLGDIENILTEWSISTGMTYWYIKHNPDNEKHVDEEDYEPNEHFHIVIQFKNPMPFKSIKDRFPYGNIQTAKKMQWAVQYLIHANDKTKEQYSWESILTNSENPNLYKPDENAVTLDLILDRIISGEIREWNQFEEIPNRVWINNKQKIENAFIYARERICMNKDRDMTVLFMSGPPGVGKTTFAKRYCEKINSPPCVSSSSNDPLQDYKGEHVLILDDMRDDSFSFSDLLKILDNHTKSSARSRYHNKAFIGETIIITSAVPLKEWYRDISRDDKRQLFRRIKCVYEFESDFINIKEYDEEKADYILTNKAPNIITLEVRKRKSMATKMFDDMGIKVEKIESEDLIGKSKDDNTLTRFIQ